MANYIGTSGNNSWTGTSTADTADGGAGNDSLFGGAGNDSLLGNTGNDSLSGGVGNDALDGGAGRDTLDGGDGNDVLNGDAGDGATIPAAPSNDDVLFGGAGNDTLRGGTGSDNMAGGLGGDLMIGDGGNPASQIEGNDTMTGDADNDTMFGNGGNDLMDGGAGQDVMDGGAGNDALTGGDGHDTMQGAAGNDQLDGGAGNDFVQGSAGIDTLTGGDGDDVLNGDLGEGESISGAGPDNDLIFGGAGNDTLRGGSGSDNMIGGLGGDLLIGDGGDAATQTQGNDTMFGEDGNDTLFGNGGNDAIDGGAGENLIYGGTGADNLVAGTDKALVYGGSGDDTIIGSDGDDIIDAGAVDGESVPGGESDDDVIFGGAGNDTITGGAGDDSAAGAAGDDSILGGLGDDTLDGAEGADTVYGGAGNDIVLGGAGDDLLAGGAGDDTVQAGSGQDRVLHVLSENIGATDFYDGGADFDTLHFETTAAEWANPAFQADVKAYLAHIAIDPSIPFTFSSIGLTAVNFEDVTFNERFVGNSESLKLTEDDASVSVDLLANDILADRASIVQIITPSTLGTVTVVTDLNATPQTAIANFVPGPGAQALNAGDVVTETLTYKVFDADGNTTTASLTITVTGVNDGASITGLSVGTITEDALTPLAGTLAVQDVDDGEAVFQMPSDLTGSYGTFTFNPATGEWGYTPTVSPASLQALAVGQQLTDSLTVTSADGTATQTIVVAITGQNDAPTLSASVLSSTENGSATLDLAGLGNDIDNLEDGTTLIYSIASQPAIGSASISGTTLTYTVGAGQDALAVGQSLTTVVTVTATDAHGASVSNDMTVTITGTNDTPTLAAGALSATENGSATLDLAGLGNDIDNLEDGTTLIYSIASQPAIGSASISGTTLTYTVGAGQDALAVGQSLTTVVTVTATDAHGASVSNDMTVTITGTNDAPTLAAGALNAKENGPAVTLNLASLGNDIDNLEDGTTLSYAITGQPSIGSASISGTTLTYTVGAGQDALAVGQSLTTVVTVTATDAHGASVSNDMTVTITGTNDAPTLAAGALSATENGSATLDLAGLGNDIDNLEDGTTLIYSIASQPSIGSASISGTTLTYTVGAGQDALAVGQSLTTVVTVTATDAHGASVSNDMTVTITGTNDAPTLAAGALSATENGSATLDLAGLGNDIDNLEDGTTLIYSIASQPSIGSASISGTTLTYTVGAGQDALAVGQSLTTVVTVTATDAHGASVSNDMTVTITGTNDAPTLAAGALSATENGSATLDLAGLGNDIDNLEDGTTLIYSIASQPAIGSASISGTTLTYTVGAGQDALAVGQSLTTVVTVTATDAHGASVSNDMTVTITGTNDAPTLAAGALNAKENGPAVTLNLASLGNDIDNLEDGTTLSYAITGQPSVGTATLSGTTLTYTGGAAHDRLAAGQTTTEVITIKATDAHGASVTSTVNVLVTGANDTPILANIQNPNPISTNAAGQKVISGTVVLNDADWTDTHSITATKLNGLDVVFTVTPPVQGVAGSISWSVVVPAGTPLPPNNASFTLTALDSSGGSASLSVPFKNAAFADLSNPITLDTFIGDGLTAVNVYDYYTNTNGGVLIAKADPTETYFGMEFVSTLNPGSPDSELFGLNPDNGAFQYLTINDAPELFEFDFLISDGNSDLQAKVQFTVQGQREGLAGGSGDDVLIGSDMLSEVIRGNEGADTLTSGGTMDSDVFAFFGIGEGGDVITDFTRGDDHIGVSAAGFGGNLVPGSNTFDVLNGSDHTVMDSGGTDGVFLFETDGADGTLYWDATGGTTEDAEVIAHLTGVTELGSEDFFIFV